jgi:hypothetical protein
MSSRTTSGSTATQTSGTSKQSMPASGHTSLPHDKVAMRAYHKWVQRGCPCGTDKQDWQEAEAELRAEMARGGNASTQQRR